MGIKLIDKINAEQTAKFAEKKFPEFRTGDIVRVSIKIKEGDKFRVQDSPWIQAIKVVKKGAARRAKLYNERTYCSHKAVRKLVKK